MGEKRKRKIEELTTHHVPHYGIIDWTWTQRRGEIIKGNMYSTYAFYRAVKVFLTHAEKHILVLSNAIIFFCPFSLLYVVEVMSVYFIFDSVLIFSHRLSNCFKLTVSLISSCIFIPSLFVSPFISFTVNSYQRAYMAVYGYVVCSLQSWIIIQNGEENNE